MSGCGDNFLSSETWSMKEIIDSWTSLELKIFALRNMKRMRRWKKQTNKKILSKNFWRIEVGLGNGNWQRKAESKEFKSTHGQATARADSTFLIKSLKSGFFRQNLWDKTS